MPGRVFELSTPPRSSQHLFFIQAPAQAHIEVIEHVISGFEVVRDRQEEVYYDGRVVICSISLYNAHKRLGWNGPLGNRTEFSSRVDAFILLGHFAKDKVRPMRARILTSYVRIDHLTILTLLKEGTSVGLK
jgi:hypothetical protein